MSDDARSFRMPGHWTVDQLRPGQPYELSEGELIECLPAGKRHSRSNAFGTLPLSSDPDVTEIGVDTGHALSPQTLRAPDLSVGNVPTDGSGWVQGPPALAVEYADRGQDQRELTKKIGQLLRAGSKYVWVVRLTGPRRVEVHEVAGVAPRIVAAGEELSAPGVLRNSIPVESLYDREASLRVTFRNLLQREGYDSLEAVRNEGREKGREEGREEGREQGHEQGESSGLRQAVRTACELLGIALTTTQQAHVETSCGRDLQRLLEQLRTTRRWPTT